jgi:lipoprotein-anchoring transpeptidase ErfK/SrfK
LGIEDVNTELTYPAARQSSFFSIDHTPRIFVTRQAGLLAIAALLGLSAPAQAQIFWLGDQPDAPDYYSDYDERPLLRQPRPPQRPARAARPHRHKAEPVKEAIGKPRGPVIVTISIEKQRLKMYDANGLFAEAPVSTGMRGHATPMGVFSVIQKNKWHRSNIYSGAPMPYMQRITWSGIAMHAGALPGYPASHGCIRMPMNFATRMWSWTRMGARVIVAPGDVSPTDISHPLLIAHKPESVVIPAAEAQPAPDTPEKLELRPSTMAPHADIIRTADASGTTVKRDDVLSDATNSNTKPDATRDARAEVPATDGGKTTGIAAADAAPAATPAPDAKPEANTDAPKPDAAKTAEPAPVKRTGHIAAYVSRKEGKLFVRQNFEPLFEVPVTIAGEGPLGTHVFTMRADKDDAKTYRWSVVSLPTRPHAEPAPRRKKGAEPVAQAPATPPSSASEALDRLTIPEDAMQKIAEAIAPGGSLIVSDQGLGGETGRGTDFIVPLR